MIWNLPFSWVLINLLVLPCLFYIPALDYLNLPRGVFWVLTTTCFVIIQVWKGQLQVLTKVDRLHALMLMFLAWSALSSTWAWQSELTWLRLTFILLAYLTFMWVRSFNEQQKTILLWVLAVQGALLSVLGILQYAEIKPFYDILQTERPGLTMGHRNVAAEYMLICMGAAISQVKRFSFKSIFALIIALMCVVTILLTRCRGVILAITVAMVIYISYRSFFISRSKLLKVATVFIYVFAFAAAYFVFQGKFIGVSEKFSSAKMHSIEMRKAHYSNTLVLIKEHLPMGVGLGNFAIQYSQYLNSWIPDKEYSDRIILRNTHSDPLECLAELGPIGFLFVLMIIWIVFIKADKSSWVKQALWCTLLAQVANSCVNFPFQVIQTQMVVALMLGCFIDSKPIGSSWSFSFPKRHLIKAIVTFALIYNGFYHIQRLQAAEQAQKGINYFFAKRPKEAEPFFRKAVELNPRQVDYLMLLAHCLREMNRNTESSSIAENVLGVFPDYLSAYNLIGLNSLKINDLNRAVRAFELSYEAQKFQESTKEKLQLAYFKLGIEFRKRGYIKEARLLEHKLQKVYPNARDSYQREALDLINLKEYDLAKSVIEKAKSIAVDEKTAYLEARLHVAQAKWIEALEALDKGLEYAPKDKNILMLKSEIQARFIRKKEPEPKN